MANRLIKHITAKLVGQTDKETFDVYDDSALHASNIVNNLTTTAAGYALDARQGKALNDSLTTAVTLLNNIVRPTAASHNCFYRGEYLGSELTGEQSAAIQAGTFDDLFIGDYWSINGRTYMIADFDYFYNTGDTKCTTHHAVIVPFESVGSGSMNSTETTVGGYVGSKMRTTNIATARNKIISDFGSSHILTHREYTQNNSGSAWYDFTIELMTEGMCFGGVHYEDSSSNGYIPSKTTTGITQFNLFRHRPDAISNRETCWLRSVASSKRFCTINWTGGSATADPSQTYSIRPYFLLI